MFSIMHNTEKPHARECAWVTMVTRLRAHVERSVLVRVARPLEWFRNPSEPVAVVDWISKFTWVIWSVPYFGGIQKVPSARTRAGDHGHPVVCAHRARGVI